MGCGFTTTVAVIGTPLQVPSVELMVNVTVTGELVVLVKVPLISPEPLAAMPVTETVLSRVQLKLVAVPDNTMVVMAEPEQVDWEAGVAMAVGGKQVIVRL